MTLFDRLITRLMAPLARYIERTSGQEGPAIERAIENYFRSCSFDDVSRESHALAA